MGSWALLDESSEVAAVHAALLPNGEVVYYSGNTGQDIPAATRVWNPSDSGLEPWNPASSSSVRILRHGARLAMQASSHMATTTWQSC